MYACSEKEKVQQRKEKTCESLFSPSYNNIKYARPKECFQKNSLLSAATHSSNTNNMYSFLLSVNIVLYKERNSKVVVVVVVVVNE